MKFNVAVLMIIGAGAIQLKKVDPTICYKGVVECDTPVTCIKGDPEGTSKTITCKRDDKRIDGKQLEPTSFAKVDREPLLTWSPTAHKPGHKVDYFVPNFGAQDEDISNTQKNMKNLNVKWPEPSFVQTGFWTQAPDGASVDN